MDWKWLGVSKELQKLREELHAPIIDRFWGFIAVEPHVMEEKWGDPAIRHTNKDWYDLAEVRKIVKAQLI